MTLINSIPPSVVYTDQQGWTLSDCLLHKTHHGMRARCWGVVVDWFLERAQTHPDETPEERVLVYKAIYERALLDDLIIAYTRSVVGRQIARDFNGAAV